MRTSLAKIVIRVCPRGFLPLALLAASFASLLLLPVAANAADDTEDLLTAVVGIRATVPEYARTATALGTERVGSGVLIDANGLIVTIGYLIMEAERVEVLLADGKPMPAEILAYDYETGFGLLRAEADSEIRPMELGSSSGLNPGDEMLVAGYGGIQAARPAIFADTREFAGYWEYLLEDALFTVPPYPQFGGAALISPAGKLLGIGSLSVGDAIVGEQMIPGNMFVPIDLLKSVLGDLLVHGRSTGSERPWLGIYTDEIEGILLVRRVADGGPAMAAGIEAGDIIAAAGGEAVVSMADFYRKVWAQGGPGDTISLTVIRDSGVYEIEVRSGDRYQWLRLRHDL